jgi:hypothetical protein
MIQELSTELGLENTSDLHPAYDHYVSEADLITWLAPKIAQLLEERTEFLFNVFYCMDVDEAKMKAALLPCAPEPADIGLARLMIERQKQRIFTKKHYQQPKLEGEEW